VDKQHNTVVGIDYSISGPALCIHTGSEWSYSNCKFFYITQRKKSIVNNKIFKSDPSSPFENDEERYDQISNFFIKALKSYKVSLVALENYAFTAAGLMTKVAENTSVLKHKLYKKKIQIKLVAPNTVKKLAGKGNFTKLMMLDAFIQETGVDMSKELNCEAGTSPASDVVDSYFLAKCAFNFLNDIK
jgi:Holliday junction resolvasome RuvABC endonuclease subunit